MKPLTITITLTLLIGGTVSSGAPSSPGRGSDVVATVTGAPITRAELDRRIGNRLLPMRTKEFETTEAFLREMITERLMEREAAKRKVTVEKLFETEIEAKVAPVTEEEKKAQYEAVKARVKDRPMEDVLKDIGANLRGQRQQARHDEYVRQLFAAAGVTLSLEPPRVVVPVVAGEPALGPAQAPVTIIEYSDYQCPYCSRAAVTLKQVRQRYGDRVRLVFRDFPLTSIHPKATKAAEAAACAGELGKFWEMNERLFAQQDKLEIVDLKTRAADLGLDATRFAACLDSGRKTAEIQKDAASAEDLGINGTPAFLVNGRFVSGSLTLERFSELIELELARTRGGAAAVPASPQAKRVR